MWGLYFIGLVAYIPASPVQGYLSLTLKKIGFSIFDSNMLSIPSAALQIFLMLALAKSSEFFGERTWHCFIGELWCMPLLIALLGLPNHGRLWGRFALTTMISGCKSFMLHANKSRQPAERKMQIHTFTPSSQPGSARIPLMSRNAPSPQQPTM